MKSSRSSFALLLPATIGMLSYLKLELMTTKSSRSSRSSRYPQKYKYRSILFLYMRHSPLIQISGTPEIPATPATAVLGKSLVEGFKGLL